MAKLTAAQISVAYTVDRVDVHIPIDGRPRRIVLDASEAVLFSNAVGNAAADSLPVDRYDRLPEVLDIKLLPFGHEAGPHHAAMRFELDQGPLFLRFDAGQLRALAAAADAALEMSKTQGSS